MIGVIRLPQMPLAMGVMDSDRRQATSPRTFMVIDEKGGEEHGLKLSLAREKRRRRVEDNLVQSVCFSRTGLHRSVRPV